MLSYFKIIISYKLTTNMYSYLQINTQCIVNTTYNKYSKSSLHYFVLTNIWVSAIQIPSEYCSSWYNNLNLFLNIYNFLLLSTSNFHAILQRILIKIEVLLYWITITIIFYHIKPLLFLFMKANAIWFQNSWVFRHIFAQNVCQILTLLFGFHPS